MDSAPTQEDAAKRVDPASGASRSSSPLKRQIAVDRQPKPLRPVARLARALGQELLLGLFVLLILFLVAWYTTPYFLRDFLNKKGSSLPDYHLNINWVEIHPWNCSLDLIDLTLTKQSGSIPVPFFKGERVHIALEWKRVIHGDLLSSITLMRPVVNFVNGPTAAQTQTLLEPAWVQTVKQLVPLRINRFQIIHGDLHYYDFHAEPQINLEMNHLELVAENLTNATHSKALMPTTVVISGNPFITGRMKCELAANVDIKQPTFSEKLQLTQIPAIDLNSFLAKYLSVYAKSGSLDFYTELVSKEGHFEGYVKPFFQNLSFEPVPKDRGTLAAIWATLVNAAKSVVTSDKGVIATNVPVKGSYQDPNVSAFDAIMSALGNAYFQAIGQGFNQPEIAPAPVQSAEKH
jgi:hypothetical protein